MKTVPKDTRRVQPHWTLGVPKFIGMVRDVGIHNPEEAYDVLIIDSLSHAWQTLLEEVDELKENKYKGNQIRAWAEVTPKYKRLVNAILSAPFHVIGTMRAKTEWSISKDGDRTTVRRDGLAPEQRAGLEYEFDMLMEINSNHVGTIIKDRTGRFQDKIEKRPGREFGLKLLEWLKDGAPNSNDIKAKKSELWNICKSVDEGGFPIFSEDETKAVIDSVKALADETPERQLEEIEAALNKQKTELFERLTARTPEPPAPPSTPPQPPPENKAPKADPPPSKKAADHEEYPHEEARRDSLGEITRGRKGAQAPAWLLAQGKTKQAGGSESQGSETIASAEELAIF